MTRQAVVGSYTCMVALLCTPEVKAIIYGYQVQKSVLGCILKDYLVHLCHTYGSHGNNVAIAMLVLIRSRLKSVCVIRRDIKMQYML